MCMKARTTLFYLVLFYLCKKRNRVNTRNTCMQQPLALIGIQGTIFSVHEVFRVHDFEIVFIFTLSIFFKKCENNESIISFNYKIHNLHKFFSY